MYANNIVINSIIVAVVVEIIVINVKANATASGIDCVGGGVFDTTVLRMRITGTVS